MTDTEHHESETLDLPRRLARAYSAMARGMLYGGSEGDSPYVPFSTAFDPDDEVTAESFRSAVRLAGWWQIELGSADDWFERTIKTYRDPAYESEEKVPIYEHLHSAMQATLQVPLTRAVVYSDDGRYHDTRRYFFGRVAGGGLAGLVTFSVET